MVHTQSDWYKIKNIDQIDSPALVLFPEHIESNIDRMIQMVGDPAVLRPHIKTHKMREIVEMQIAKGINKFKCATIAEAEMLGETGAKEVLLAYQPVGPKVNRLLKVIEKFPLTQYTALVDDPSAARAIGLVFAKANKTLPVYLDLDVGMHRTGVAVDDGASALYWFCKTLAGVEPVGLHMYDGHLHNPSIDQWQEKCNQGFKQVRQLADKLEAVEGDKLEIIAGGTPTFSIHAKRKSIQCSPGTCVLWDWGYANKLSGQDFLFGALVISRIISKTSDRYICTDLGHKSIAAEKPFPRAHFLNLPNAKAILQSEEHLVLEVDDNKKYDIGMVLYGVPKHICPTCALYERAHVVENQVVTKNWKVVSRDRMISV